MKTKKFFLAALAMMCAMTTTTVFTSCGDDDDDKGGNTQTTEIKGIGTLYTITVLEQMARLCDYTITYYGNDNELKTETMAWKIEDGIALWTKTVTSTKFPATFGVKINVKVKDNVQLTDATIPNIQILKKEMYLEGITTDAKKAWGKTVAIGSGSVTNSCKENKIGDYLAVWNKSGGLINKTYTFDENGNQLNSGTIE